MDVFSVLKNLLNKPKRVCKLRGAKLKELIIRKANFTDIDDLIRIRISFLNDGVTEKLSNEEECELTIEFKKYVDNHLNKDFIALLALIDHKVISSAFIAINEKNGIPPFSSERFAILTNVFTYSSYRKKGIATKIISQLIDYCKELKISCIELTAKETKIEFYKNFGFCKKDLYGEIMYLCL